MTTYNGIIHIMFGDDDEGKSTGDLARFGKEAFVAMIFIIAAPTIVAPLMGVDISTFCAIGEDEQCQENVIFSDDVTGLISIALNAIRIGGAVVIIVAFGLKGSSTGLFRAPDRAGIASSASILFRHYV